MLSLMIDFESFGLATDAVLTQIGCAAFDSETYEVVAKFNQPISVVDGLLHGFSITPSTLDFWGKELKKNSWDADTVDTLFYSKVPVSEAAKRFHKWLDETFEGNNFNIWANGILFDVPKADYLLKRFGYVELTERTRYSNVEDLRTLRKTCQRINRKGMDKIESILRAKYKDNVHNAMYDCYYQIELLQACMTVLKTSNHFNTKGEEPNFQGV